MRKLLSERLATNGLLTILALVVVFHGLVLVGLIPYEIVWGGRLKSQAQMVRFETISLTLNLLMLVAVAVKAGFLRLRLPRLLLQTMLWLMVALFLVNTIGNLLSANAFERAVFTPLTLILALFSFRIAV